MEAALGEATTDLNIEDQYECYAFIKLEFVCENCRRELPVYQNGLEFPSVEWCKRAAQLTKDAVWVIPKLWANGTYDLTLKCPDCAVLV